MKRNEKIKKEIALTFDFVRHLIDNPADLEKIPDGCEIVFRDKSEATEIKSKKKYPVDVKPAFEVSKKAA